MDFSERDRIISLINEQEGFTPLITGFSEGGEVEDESPDEMSEDNEMEPEGFADGGEVTGGLFSEAADREAARQAYAQPASQPATGPLAATIKPVSTQTLVQPTLPSAIQPTQAPAASAVTTPSAADILKTIPTFAAPSFTTPGAPAGGIPAVATTPTMAKPTLRPEKELPAQVVNLAPLQVLESFGGTPVSFARPESAKGYLTPEAAGAVGGVSFSGAPGAAGTAAGATTRTPLGYEYSTYRTLTPEQLAGSGNKAQITDMFKGIVTQQEKDVAALRNEYNQAMSYGNMDLANQLKPILQAQEAEVAAAKADQTMAAKYFTGVGGAYETPQMLQQRVAEEQFKALKLPGYTGVDLGAIGFTPETKVDPFTAALNQQKNEYTAAQNVYNRLSSAYGKDSQYAKDYLEQYVNPQKAEYDRMLAAQKVATGAYGAITAGAAYKGFTAPKLADIRNVVQTENTYKPIITGFETNVNNLIKARDQADAMGLSGYSQRLNQLIDAENAKLEQARGERQSAIDKAQPDPMRDYILGKQLTAQKIEGFTGVDIGNVDFGKMQASAFDPIILRQQQDVNAAQNTYNQLVNLYGANNDTTKAFLNDVLNPQKQELTQATALKTAANAAIGAYNAGRGYAYIAPPNIAVNKSTSDATINKAFDDFIKNNYEKRIATLDAAKAKAEQAGLGQYGDYFNQLMDTQRSFIDRANEARNATFAKRDAATRAKGSPPEGEIADPVAKLVAQGSRTKDDGMDSTARAMLKKFAGGGDAKADAAPESSLYTNETIKSMTPAHARIFLETLLMSKEDREKNPITEKNFSDEEKRQIFDAISNARKNRIAERGWNIHMSDSERKEYEKLDHQLRAGLGVSKKEWAEHRRKEQAERARFMTGKGTVNYADYPFYSDELRDSTLSQKGAVRNTLGRFVYETMPDGKINIREIYDFKDDLTNEMAQRPSSAYKGLTTTEKLGTLLVDTLNNPVDQGGGFAVGRATLPSRVGSAFIGSDGRPVNITIDPREIMPGYAGYATGGDVKKEDATGYAAPLEASEMPIVGSVGRGIQRAAEFASAPFGYENPPVRMLMDLLSVPGAGRAIEDVAQGLPLTRGTGQARQLSGNAKALLEAAVNAAPGAGPATKAVAKGAKKAAKELGPIAAEKAMKYAPAAEPMYAVKPKGGTFFPEGYGSRMEDYLESVVKDLSKSETLAGKDAQAVADFIRTKGRKYLTTNYGTSDDPLRDALLEGRLPRYGSDKERFRSYLMNAAKEGDPEALQDLERAYDQATGIRAISYVPPEMEGTSYAVSGKVDRAVREKMAAEGVEPDLMNPDYPTPRDKKSLLSEYSTPAQKELARLMSATESMPIDEARQAFLQNIKGGEKALIYAAEKGEPVYDVMGPVTDFLYPRNVAQGIASIPVDELQRMSFPEAVIKGAQNMRFKRDWESVIENAKSGKPVPKEIYFQGTQPVYELDKNQKWVRIMTPDAVELEGAAMRHSIGGYKTSDSYNLGGRPAFESGLARVFSLRNEKGVPQVTVESKFTDDGGLEITQIKSKFNSMPTAEEKKAVFDLFDTLGPTKFKADNYSSTRTGDRMEEIKSIDWGNEYQDYLKYKNKGEE